MHVSPSEWCSSHKRSDVASRPHLPRLEFLYQQLKAAALHCTSRTIKHCSVKPENCSEGGQTDRQTDGSLRDERSVPLMEILFGIFSVIVKSCRSRWIRGVSVRREREGGNAIKPTQKFAATRARCHIVVSFFSFLDGGGGGRGGIWRSLNLSSVFSDIQPRARYKRARESEGEREGGERERERERERENETEKEK